MSLTVKARIGKKRILVIPKTIAKNLGLDEGSAVRITATENKIVIEPLRDAIWLSLHGEKVAQITLKELEDESIEQQRKNLKE
ncbi:MAG: AbrB/MazE/SpoVT family DNA-binding domain-containing protein [Thermoprotei archaeon]|nr:MAG: AbrB/MazE/SpoVT family DNA-binding domain-containing protein [Thermoprotei archaeon]